MSVCSGMTGPESVSDNKASPQTNKQTNPDFAQFNFPRIRRGITFARELFALRSPNRHEGNSWRIQPTFPFGESGEFPCVWGNIFAKKIGEIYSSNVRREYSHGTKQMTCTVPPPDWARRQGDRSGV